MSEPLVNSVIRIRQFKKLQPFITSEGYKVKAVFVLLMLKPNRHEIKLILNRIPGSLPRTWPREKTPGGLKVSGSPLSSFIALC